ncbi:MAG TPA: hypothetical protein VMB72_01030 [Acidimicrobiales bacterium]|nr:hypothetical protein [Acidimicrobiales bacterium]
MQRTLWVTSAPAPPAPAPLRMPPPTPPVAPWRRRRAAALLCLAAAVGVGVFFGSLPGIDLARMNGLGLLSALPAGALVGVAVLGLAFVAGLGLGRPHPVGLGALLVGLVVCLDGVTAVVEAEPRFPTSYQILGFVDYVSRTGHTAPGLDAYFSWPGFFSFVSFVAGSAGVHSLLGLVRVWPTLVDLLSLPPLFLLMRGLRLPWRARWLAGLLFTVGNWVGQDYFSPQSFNILLYLVFVAVLVHWFTDAGRGRGPARWARSWPARVHRRLFGSLRPGERPPPSLPAGQRIVLLLVLIGIFCVSTVSHQLTPLAMIVAAVGLVLTRRSTVPGLPVLLGVVLAGYVSFEAVGYWSGHFSTVFGTIGHLGSNVGTSVNGRLAGNTALHLVALHAKEVLAAAVLGLAAVGLVRRRRAGLDDRVLIVLLVVPIVLLGVLSYGGEIALRTYLFMLPAACPLAASAFFVPGRPVGHRWITFALLGGCAVVLPVLFFLARYSNETYEQIPAGELSAADWVYAHDAHGVRLLWLSTAPATDVTPQMPWAYRDIDTVEYLPTQAPRDPDRVGGLVSALRAAGPGSYLIATHTQVEAMQETAGYPAGWEPAFERAMARTPDVRVMFVTRTAVVYALRFPPGTRQVAVRLPTAAYVPARFGWTRGGEVVFWVLAALLVLLLCVRVWRPSARLGVLWVAVAPLCLVLVADIALRFVVLS